MYRTISSGLALCAIALLTGCSPSGERNDSNHAQPSAAGGDAAAIIAAQSKAIAEQKAKDKAEQDAALRRAAESYQGDLPFGETGQGESVDLFIDVCLERFTKDMSATFETARTSGYEVIMERSAVLIHREMDEEIPTMQAWTRSPADLQHGTACPIRLDIDYSSYSATCEVRIEKACPFFDPRGVFFEKKLLENEHVSLMESTFEGVQGEAKNLGEIDCSDTTFSVSDVKKRFYKVSHPAGNVKSARLEYTLCNSRNVKLIASIPWIED